MAEIVDLTTPVARLMREWKSENTAYDAADEAFDAGEISGDEADQHVSLFCDREAEITAALADTPARGWRDVQLKLHGLRKIIEDETPSWADERDLNLLESVLADCDRLLGS